MGIGDDAALVRPRRGWELALTTDLFLEGVHFRRDRDPAPVCGRRLATRALSDLAAMGAEPLALLVSLAAPATLPPAWAHGLMRGLLAAAAEAGAGLIGGDSSAASHLALDVVGVGQLPPRTALLRSGARAGDGIYVSGPLGLAALGRELAHGGKPPRTALDRQALAAHQRPRARWELGQRLRGRARSAMDLSDGLALDLHRLCRAGGVGAVLEPDALPAPAGLERALFGGEDYELLFTLPARQPPPRGFAVHRIGSITANPDIWLQTPPGSRRRLPAQGWESWRRPAK